MLSAFYKCTTSWFSAEFVLVPFSECQNLLRKLGHSDELIAMAFSDSNIFLYEVREADLTIQILCSSVDRLNYDIHTMKWVEEEE